MHGRTSADPARKYRVDIDSPAATIEKMATLEAAQADYRAVLTAVNALGANQRDHALAIGALKADVAEVKTDIAEVKTELRGFRRSADENLAELRNLIIGLRDT